MSSKILNNIKELEDAYLKPEYANKTRIISIIAFILQILTLIYCGLVVMLGYNWIVPSITGLPTINLAQALLLDCFISFVVKTKLSDEDLKDRSPIYNLIHTMMIIYYNTFALGMMFIIHLFI